MQYLKTLWINFLNKKAEENGYIKVNLDDYIRKDQIPKPPEVKKVTEDVNNIYNLPKNLTENQVSQAEIQAVRKALDLEIITVTSYNVQAEVGLKMLQKSGEELSNIIGDVDKIKDRIKRNSDYSNALKSFVDKIKAFDLSDELEVNK